MDESGEVASASVTNIAADLLEGIGVSPGVDFAARLEVDGADPVLRMSETPRWSSPPVPLGHHPPEW